jgi:hypothetical protein
MPFGAWSNGLPAVALVPLVDLDERHAPVVLEALRAAGVAACIAPSRPTGRTPAPGAEETARLWVDVPGRAIAEDLLLRLLPRLRLTETASPRARKRRRAGPGRR